MRDPSILAHIESRGQSAPRISLRPLEGDAPDDLPALSPTASSRYQALGEIARGGVGVVVKARDLDLGRDVALKTLRDRHGASPELVQRFVEEAQIGGQLQHPGIVPVYELGLNAEQRPFFTMKFVKGETLAAALDARTDPVEDQRRMLSVFVKVCQTIAYAHSRGVIHRDLKPSNVMIGGYGEVLVADWGFAKVMRKGGVADERRAQRSHVDMTKIETIRSGSGGSVTGSVFGTPAYMPPEQALGHVEELSERSDVFSLGAILTEILTGVPPYIAESDREILALAAKAQTAETKKRLETSGADETLIALALSCLANLPKDRPKNAGVLADAVAGHLAAAEERTHRSRLQAIEDREKAAKAETKAEAARTQALEHRRRRRFGIAVAAGVLLLLLAGGGAWFGIRGQQAAREREAVQAVRDAIEEANLLRGNGNLDGAAVAAARAADLSESGEVPDALVEEATDLQADLAAQLEKERERAALEAEDAEILGELADTRVSTRHASGRGGAWLTVFRRFGIDVEKLNAGDLEGAIRSRSRPVEFASYLDATAWSNRENAELREKLVEVARLIDPDPWRSRLRDALLQNDADALCRLAESEEIESLPVRTLSLLLSGLRDMGKTGEMLRLARRAHRQYPDDFWCNYFLLLDRTTAAREERIRHLYSLTALQPESAAVRQWLADELRSAGETEQAIAEAEHALELEPGYPNALATLGFAHVMEGRKEEGIVLLRKAIETAGEDYWTEIDAATGLSMAGETEEALAVLRRTAREHPEDATSESNIGCALGNLGDQARALPHFDRAVEADPTRAELHTNRGICLNMMGSFQKARAALERSLELDPGNPNAHFQLGIALAKLKAPNAEVIACFRKVLALAPTHSRANLILGAYLKDEGDLDGAIEAYRSEVRHHPEDSLAWQRLGHACSESGEFAESARAYEKAVELDPGNADVQNAFAVALWKSGEQEKAIQTFKATLEIDENYAFALSNLASDLSELGRFEEAIPYYERARAARPGIERLARGLSIALYKCGRLEESEKVAVQSTQKFPESASAWNQLGYVRSRRRGGGEAVAAFRHAVELDPKMVLAWENLATALVYLEKYEEALESARTAVRLAPEGASPRNTLAFSLAAAGRPEEADLEYRWAIRHAEPEKSAAARNGLAWLLVTVPEVYDPREAILHARKAVEQNQEKPMYRGTLALALLETGEPAESLRILDAGPAPERPDSLALQQLTRALAHAKLGNLDAARRHLEQSGDGATIQSWDRTTFDRMRSETLDALK